jgi:hypothetical protein
MEEEKFKITEFEQRRLIIDLLIRICVELETNRYVLRAALSEKNSQTFQLMGQKFQEQYKLMSRKLRETIFANYGHLDKDDFFPPGDVGDIL